MREERTLITQTNNNLNGRNNPNPYPKKITYFYIKITQSYQKLILTRFK